MTCVALTQRVEVVPSYAERRDCLDQRWAGFLARCGLVPVPIANNPALVPELLAAARCGGVVLTGGGDLAAYGGKVPERDATEAALLGLAIQQRLPVIGVCRGMQALQHFFGVRLARVAGHVAAVQEILIGGTPETVNSYHDLGTRETAAELEVWATARDGVVKAVRHRELPLLGIMWHPERMAPFRQADIELFRRTFGGR
jgi:putative glutamine amidotransferase